MKFSSKKPEQGSVLVITLITCGVIVLVLASYLVLLASRYNLTGRSTAWNSAMPVLEAGIEEALTHLQSDTGSPGANGWTASTVGGQPVNTKRRDFADGSYANVTIYNAASASATIYSSGFVPAPFRRGYISRTVRVVTTSSGTSLFSKAILTRSTINFAGDMQVNSYDSSNTNYSNPNGTYNTNKTLANAWLAAMAGSGTAIDLAGSKVYGGIQYPAGASYLLGSGTVGDTAYVNNAANSGTIQSGYKDNTLNITIPPTPLPTVDPSTWPLLTVQTTNIGGITYNLVPNGDWSIGNSTTFFHSANILPQGNARLYVGIGGKCIMSSGYNIKIPQGTSFQIYNNSSTDAVFTGFSNDSGIPSKFYYWGLSGTTGSKLTLTGSGYFAGAIYAYYQDVILTGGSSGNIRDFYGALVANTVKNSGHFYMAYDQALGGGGTGGLVVSSWTEL